MLKKTITYENPFTNEQMSEEHYFHISKADLVQMEMEEHGTTYSKDGNELTGMQAKLQKIVDSKDGRAIMEEIKDIIRRAYGVKDGDRFLKNSTLWENFSATEAYSQLIFDLCTDAGAAAEFMNGIIPNNLEKIAADVRAIAERQAASGATPAEATAEALDNAQERLKASTPSPETPDPTGLTQETAEPQNTVQSQLSAERQAEIDAATVENPVTLTQAELAVMNMNQVKVGLGSGKFQL